jgi:hypothetical protein
MNKLQRKVDLADKQVKSQVNAMLKMYLIEVGDILQKHFDTIILETSNCFAHIDGINITKLLSSHSYFDLQHKIKVQLQQAAKEVEEYWFNKRRYIELISRVGMTFVDKKAGPPWIKTKLKLKKAVSTEDRFDPRKGHIQLQLSKMAKSICNQIEQGALKQESSARIIMRVKNMFNNKKKKGIRESDESPKYNYYNPNLGPVDEFDMQGPVDVQYGFFKPDDIEQLNAEMIRANGQEFRQYQTWFTDELRANNTQMYQLEQTLYSDTLNLFSSGQADSVSYLKGIQDLTWQVQRPGVCDCCDARQGLTMTEIKAQIKDDYGDKPPSLHPRCRCELIPKISDKYKDADLEQQGVEWNPETGALKVPDSVRDKYKLDLSLPEFVKYLQNGGGQ